MNGFDLSTISNCYVGSTPASAIYISSQRVWPSTPPPSHDYSHDYFTIKSLSNNCNLVFSINNNRLNVTNKMLRVRINNGAWYDPGNGSVYGSITINENDEVSVYMDIDNGDIKGRTDPSIANSNSYDPSLYINANIINSNLLPDLVIYGNEGSLYWGQDFTSHITTLPRVKIDYDAYGTESFVWHPFDYRNNPQTTIGNGVYISNTNTLDTTNFYRPTLQEQIRIYRGTSN